MYNNYEKTREVIITMHAEARNKVIDELLKRNLEGLTIYTKGGQGIRTRDNDRREYCWIRCFYRGREYWLTFFHSEMDKWSGNVHTQYRLMFVYALVKNVSNTTSPNEITGRDITDTDKDCTDLVFNSYKWYNPAEEIEGWNKGSVTPGDILESEDAELTSKVVDCFIRFIRRKHMLSELKNNIAAYLLSEPLAMGNVCIGCVSLTLITRSGEHLIADINPGEGWEEFKKVFAGVRDCVFNGPCKDTEFGTTGVALGASEDYLSTKIRSGWKEICFEYGNHFVCREEYADLFEGIFGAMGPDDIIFDVLERIKEIDIAAKISEADAGTEGEAV